MKNGVLRNFVDRGLNLPITGAGSDGRKLAENPTLRALRDFIRFDRVREISVRFSIAEAIGIAAISLNIEVWYSASIRWGKSNLAMIYLSVCVEESSGAGDLV